MELFDAAKDGNVGEVLRLLLAGDADPSAKYGFQQRTPLHIACLYGHLDVVRALLLAKADVESTDKDENTPLPCAAATGSH